MWSARPHPPPFPCTGARSPQLATYRARTRRVAVPARGEQNAGSNIATFCVWSGALSLFPNDMANPTSDRQLALQAEEELVPMGTLREGVGGVVNNQPKKRKSHNMRTSPPPPSPTRTLCKLKAWARTHHTSHTTHTTNRLRRGRGWGRDSPGATPASGIRGCQGQWQLLTVLAGRHLMRAHHRCSEPLHKACSTMGSDGHGAAASKRVGNQRKHAGPIDGGGGGAQEGTQTTQGIQTRGATAASRMARLNRWVAEAEHAPCLAGHLPTRPCCAFVPRPGPPGGAAQGSLHRLLLHLASNVVDEGVLDGAIQLEDEEAHDGARGQE
jgi:hypothetical protein